MESVTPKGIYIVGCQACLPRQVESNPDTGTVFGLHVFRAHQFGPRITGRTPEDPLVQDSLNGGDAGPTWKAFFFHPPGCILVRGLTSSMG